MSENTVEVIESAEINTTSVVPSEVNEATETNPLPETNTEVKGTGKRGRPVDTTPNKEFVAQAKKVRDNEDGTVVFAVPYNDENGIRKYREETRTLGKRGGHKKADAATCKVFTCLQERTENGSMKLTIPYNDANGVRMIGTVFLSVNAEGLLEASV